MIVSSPLSRSFLTALVALSLAGCGEEARVRPTRDTAEQPPWPANHRAEDSPSLAVTSRGEVWVVYQAWDGQDDSLELGLLTDWTGPRVTLHRSETRVLGTALAADGSDTLHAVWSEQVADGWALRGLLVAPDAERGKAGAVSVATTLVPAAGGSLVQPVMVSDAEGRLLLAWMDLRDAGMTIRAAARAPGGDWSETVAISSNGRSGWSPAATSVAPGEFAVVWDAAVDGDYDVHLARVSVGADGRPVVTTRHRVTDTPRFEAHASVAARDGRLYVAYDVGPANWGREGSLNKLEVALHNVRDIEIAVVEGDRVAPLASPFMDGVNENLRTGCEQPILGFDSNGNMVLFFRGLPLPAAADDPTDRTFQRRAELRGGKGVGWRTSIWYSYLSFFDGRQWNLGGRHHVGLAGSEGRSDAPIAVGEQRGGGLAYAVVGDGRQRETMEIESGDEVFVDHIAWWQPVTTAATGITVGRTKKGEPAPAPATGTFRTLPPLRPEPMRGQVPERTRRLPDGRELRLALGDLHRHTDLSRCSSNWDGPFTDALRYAFDAGELDFLAVTDHFEHMTAYDWRRNLAFMDAYDAPGRMVNLRAYERADLVLGHRNVISRGEIPLVGYREHFHPERDAAHVRKSRDLWKHLVEGEVITIPHTTAGMTPNNPTIFDWLSFHPAFDRIVEIYQGYRGSSEAVDAPRAIESVHPHRFARPALDGGLHFGFVASSDHQSSDGAFAGAWVTGLTRAEVFEALHDRRTFAATARMALWAEWNGVPMGRSARAEPGPTTGLALEVEAFGRELALVELVVDGQIVESRAVSGSQARIVFDGESLDVPEHGTRYAYVRVRTTDEELGWSSPVRLGAGDWSGPDGLQGDAAYGEELGRELELTEPFGARWQGDGPGSR